MVSKAKGNPNTCTDVCVDQVKNGVCIEKDLLIDSGISVECNTRFVRVYASFTIVAYTVIGLFYAISSYKQFSVIELLQSTCLN